MDFSNIYFVPDLKPVVRIEGIMAEDYVQCHKIQSAYEKLGSNFEP
jgi:hypothetical protein